MQHLAPAVFIDRDGTLMEEVNYCSDPDKVRLFPGVTTAIKALRAKGFRIIIITNQSGIGRGTISLPQYESVQNRLLELIGHSLIDATYFCPDHPDTPSDRRKPNPGMILEAARDWKIDLTNSWMIGDKDIDVECGDRAGTRCILVQTGYGTEHAATRKLPEGTVVLEDLPASADHILKSVQP